MTKKARKTSKSEYENKGGRPTSLTPEVLKTIVTYIKRGSYIETAAIAAGITRKTFYNWLKKGNEDNPEEIYRNFVEEIEEALSISELADVAIISKAAEKGVWQAAAWRLERKHPERWGRRDKIEHVGKDGGPISTDESLTLKALQGLTDDQINAKIKDVLSRLSSAQLEEDKKG